jgi:hypothetical protein
VSPLWRDEIHISLAPRELRLERLGRGLKPRLLAGFQTTVDTGDYAGWEPALSALGRCLDEAAWQNANARVVLSDHWVRYAIVPWSDDLRGHAERLTHARYTLADVYGDLVADWTVRLSDSLPGTSQIACAMPTTLFTALSDLIEHHGLRLLSIQAWMIASFNRWRRSLPATGAWLVSVEEGSLAAARLASGGWDRVHKVRIGRDWSVELRRLQTFARLESSRPEGGRVFVDAPASLRDAAGANDPALEWLGNSTPTSASDGVQVADES